MIPSPSNAVARGEHAGRAVRLAVLAIALFAAGAAVLAASAYASQVATVEQDARLRARGAAADVDRYVQSQWFTLQAIASLPAFRGGDVGAMRGYFDALDAESMGVDAGISFVDGFGVMQARTGGYTGPPIDFSDRDHIRRGLATRQPTVSSAFVGAVNRVPIVAFTVPVFDHDGTFRGLIGSGIRLNALSVGADHLRYAGGTSVVIIDGLGQIIAGPRTIENLLPVADTFAFESLRAAGEGWVESSVGPYGDMDQLLGYAVAPSAQWTVLVQTPSSSALAQPRTNLAIALLAIVAGAVATIGILLWAARRLDRAAAAEANTLRELELAVETLERRQGLSDAFVGVMSHELRTPVTTIYGTVQVLLKHPDRRDGPELLEDVAEEAERLRRITEDLLVLSRAEHGTVELHPEPVLVQRLVPEVLSDVRRRFPAAEIETALPIDLPAIAGDPAALHQVLNNLVTNAAKHGGGAPIRVVGDETAGGVEISISDQGPGVAEDELSQLFELFYRAPSNARRTSGTGIGLFVARELVGAMGGSIAAERVEPHGLRVIVRLARLADPAVDPEREGAGSVVLAAS